MLTNECLFWKEMLQFLQYISDHKHAAILPDPFFANVSSAFEKYVGFQNKENGNVEMGASQQDSMEFLTFFLDGLNEQIKENPHLNCMSQTDDGWSTIGKGGSKMILDESSKRVAQRTASSSVVSKIFQGLLRLVRVILFLLRSKYNFCRCEVHYRQKKIQSTTFQSFHCLTVNFVRENRDRQKLSSALQNFFGIEVLCCIICISPKPDQL